jgi:hypothetical protein
MWNSIKALPYPTASVAGELLEWKAVRGTSSPPATKSVNFFSVDRR